MRPIWKGTLSFGLINIPVSIYSASVERELKFSLLHKKDLSQIRYARICKAEDKEVPYEEIVKGFETDGHFVVLSDEDFEKANPEHTKAISILDFTEESEIDSIYFEKPYFLSPEANSAKAYILLRQALEKSKKVAVVKFVMKNHEHLGIVKPHEHLLILIQLRLHAEMRSAKEIQIPKEEKIAPKEMEMALQLIEQQTAPFHPEKFKDTYTQQLLSIIKEKEKYGKITTKGKEPKPSKIVDIMSLLKDSLKKPAKEKKAKAR